MICTLVIWHFSNFQYSSVLVDIHSYAAVNQVNINLFFFNNLNIGFAICITQLIWWFNLQPLYKNVYIYCAKRLITGRDLAHEVSNNITLPLLFANCGICGLEQFPLRRAHGRTTALLANCRCLFVFHVCELLLQLLLALFLLVSFLAFAWYFCQHRFTYSYTHTYPVMQFSFICFPPIIFYVMLTFW